MSIVKSSGLSKMLLLEKVRKRGVRITLVYLASLISIIIFNIFIYSRSSKL